MKGGDAILLLIVLGAGAFAVWWFVFRSKQAGAATMGGQRAALATLAAQGKPTITAGELSKITGAASVLPPSTILRTTKPPPKRSAFGLPRFS